MYSIHEVDNERDILIFIRCEKYVWKRERNHILPLEEDEKTMLGARNPMLRFCKMKLWYVADESGAAVGRIGAVINERLVEKSGERVGRFMRIAFIDDAEVVKMLISTASEWLREEGCVRMDGPLGFCNLDRQGALTAGFDRLPSVASEHTPEYVALHLKRLGFRQLQEWEEFRLDISGKLPEKIARISAYVYGRYGITCRTLKRNEFDTFAPQIFELFNSSFAKLFGTFVFPDEVVKFFIERYRPLLRGRNIVVALSPEGQLLGFTIWMPSLSKVLLRARGKMSPIDIANYLIHRIYNNTIDLLLSGIEPQWQGRGVAALLTAEVWRQARRIGARYVETTAMLADNKTATLMWRMFPHEQHKRKAAFSIDL